MKIDMAEIGMTEIIQQGELDTYGIYIYIS